MKSKVIVPPPISRGIRTFGLSREVLLELLVHIHEGTPRDYASSCHRRMKNDRYYQYRISVMEENGREHLFLLAVDDTTSPDHLRIVNIGYAIL
ncbi:MAG: hypothetical protein HYX68_19140 [Planctomycetes bacterium]|nr:hypothetical protein [Planctomycetota bacterium]